MGESFEREVCNLVSGSQVSSLVLNSFKEEHFFFHAWFLIKIKKHHSSVCSSKVISAYLESSDTTVNEMAKKELEPLVKSGILRLPAANESSNKTE